MKKMFVLLIMSIFLVMSCSKKAIKPVSLESQTAQSVIETINMLKTAYVHKDEAALTRYTTDFGFSSNFKAAAMDFSSAELSFTPMWVDIKSDTLQVQVSWTGKWVYHGHNIEENGVAGFVVTGPPYRVDKILRDNPFAVLTVK
ncbi:hypothetical protein [Candidatus Magnetomonas plexicatena]|uniref:hypothetical protein n=1 Tax=Candidatus Magnetomonas plexicatena TaxID=2552947 RepID=UPI0011001656|nr:hypothetical protein E2O03_003630 [Nitrospirales bacterium LBB_01]